MQRNFILVDENILHTRSNWMLARSNIESERFLQTSYSCLHCNNYITKISSQQRDGKPWSRYLRFTWLQWENSSAGVVVDVRFSTISSATLINYFSDFLTNDWLISKVNIIAINLLNLKNKYDRLYLNNK